MHLMSGVRSWLPLLVVVSCTQTPLVATPKPKPQPAPPQAVTPAKPLAPVPEPPKPVPQQWKIETRYMNGDQSASMTIYAAEQRQRVELDAGGALVTQCDLRRVLQINENAKAYAAVPLIAPTSATDVGAAATARVVIRTVTTDTGERRMMHGQETRRIRIVTTTEPEGQGCDIKQSRTETDGWYAEVPDLQACALVAARPTDSAKTCTELHQPEDAGPGTPGYPLAYTTTTFDASGKEVSRISAEVTSLVREPRNEALFDAPAAFTQVADAETLATAARRAELEALGTTPKTAGMIRVGVVLPSDASDRSVDREALGNEVLEAFNEPPIEAVPIVAATASEQTAEAAMKECDFLLRTELAQVTTSKPGRVGGLMRRAAGGGNPAELHEAKINFELSSVRTAAAPRKHAASAKTGGFTWRRAAGLARFAGRLYFGMTAGVMNAMLSASSGGPTSAADPTLNALSTLLLPEKADEEQQSPEAVIVAAVERGATELKRTLAPSKPGAK